MQKRFDYDSPTYTNFAYIHQRSLRLWLIIVNYRPKRSDFYTPSETKLPENQTLSTGKIPHGLNMGVPLPRMRATLYLYKAKSVCHMKLTKTRFIPVLASRFCLCYNI